MTDSVVLVLKRSSGSRLPFLALWGYLAAQAYTIPVLTLGPGWPVWPTLPSLFAALLAASALIGGRPLSARARIVAQVLSAILLGCILSTTWWGVRHPDALLGFSQASQTSAFLLLRVTEAIVVFWSVSRVAMSPSRLEALCAPVTLAITIAALAVILTYFEAVPLSSLAPQIPADPGTSGPWSRFHLSMGEGWGTVGYNHGYVAVHLLMLLILRLQLRRRAMSGVDVALLTLTGVAILLTGSRAGFAAYVFFAAAVAFRQPRVALTLGAAAAASFLVFPALGLDIAGPVESVLDRQAALVAPIRVENLAGRWDIWTLTLQTLTEEPIAFFLGNGFGTAIDFVGHNAHMMPLQVLVELGIVGLIGFGMVVVGTLRLLSRSEAGGRVLLWGTVALLLSSLTQETLYPSTAFGSFIALFLAGLALFVKQLEAQATGRLVPETPAPRPTNLAPTSS